MTTRFGTLAINDLLAVTDQSVVAYGEDNVNEAIREAVAAHNRLVEDMLGNFVEFTTESIARYGGGDDFGIMEEVDEYARVDAQKGRPAGVDIGWPLRKTQRSLQWDREWFRQHTPAELADQYLRVEKSDRETVFSHVRKALFTPTNNLTYVDRFVDRTTKPLRALLNADGAPIPPDEFGNTFNAATHTHYMATAAMTAANVQAAIDNVVEHGVDGDVRLFISRFQEPAVTGFTSNFDARQIVNVAPGGGSTADVVAGAPLDPFRYHDRSIGFWNGAVEVFVKPWIPAGYLVPVDLNPSARVLRYRRRAGIGGEVGGGNLDLVASDDHFPLRASTYEREFGVSPWQRHKAAILYVGGASYVAPSGI